jgi:hypothetical protein
MKCWNSAIWCIRYDSNYSSCTGRSSENICSSSGGAQEKGKTGWNSIWNAETQQSNAQDTRVIIVVVQVGAVKIYVAAVEALRKKERQGESPYEMLKLSNLMHKIRE